MNLTPATRASLLALCFGNFIIGTGTLIVPGMLPQLAEGLGVTLPHAGLLVTAFAATVCVGAPLLAGATSRIDRRALLVAMQLLYFAGHAVAALVSSFAPMVLTRMVTSVGAALFTAQAAATAALLVPAEHRGRAIALVFLGWSVASVAGMPIGAYVGATLGWQAGFALVALGALVGAALVWFFVPAGLRTQTVNAATWRATLGNRAVLANVGVTALSAAAGFTVLSYFVPAAQAFVGASPEHVSLLLLAFGISGVTGNVLAVRYMDRIGPARVVLYSLLFGLAAHLAWPWTRGSEVLLALVMLVWGVGVFASNSAQQARAVALAPAAAPVSVALNSSAIYLGQAIGPAAGGLLIAHVSGSQGYALLAAISVPLLVAAIVLSQFASLKMRAQLQGKGGSAHVQGRPA